MNWKLTALIALSLIIGNVMGYEINYAVYQPRIVEVQSELTRLLSEISADVSVEILRVRIVSSSMLPTLKDGDIVLVRRIIDPNEINAAPYPDGDIIVFHKPDSLDTLVVHRATKRTKVNGIVYFTTKGDGSPVVDFFSGDETWNGTISYRLVVGKVIFVIRSPS